MPGGIQKRISNLSHSKEIFEAEIRPYQHELDKRGYKCKLQYTPTEPNNSSETKRKRKILYFNPPWNAAVTTDIARKTFRLVDEHFKEGTLLGKLFNTRFGKLVKTQGKPCCISKAMGIHFPHPIFMSIFEKK